MRYSLIALALASCEASAPTFYAQDAADTTDPYGDSEPDCPAMTARQKTYWLCSSKGKVALYGSCVTAKQAQMACADLSDKSLCHDAESGLCVSCVPL